MGTLIDEKVLVTVKLPPTAHIPPTNTQTDMHIPQNSSDTPQKGRLCTYECASTCVTGIYFTLDSSFLIILWLFKDFFALWSFKCYTSVTVKLNVAFLTVWTGDLLHSFKQVCIFHTNSHLKQLNELRNISSVSEVLTLACRRLNIYRHIRKICKNQVQPANYVSSFFYFKQECCKISIATNATNCCVFCVQ